MCGITGVLCFHEQGVQEADVRIFHQLFKASVLRGEDGSGIFWVGDKKSGAIVENDELSSTSWLKMSGVPHELYNTKNYAESEWELAASRFIIGHNRAKTTGEATTDHAHPFEHEHITLVHNGTIHSIDGFNDFNKFPTDSMALCHALASTDDHAKILKGINGAAAVIWYNYKTQRLYIYRNRDRPLAFHQQWGRYYIASEPMMLKWIMMRNEWTAKGISKENGIFMFKENVLYEFEALKETPKETEIQRYVYQMPAMQPVIHTKNHGNPIVHLPVKKEPKVRKYMPTKKYFGLMVGDTVIFESCNIEFLNQKGNHAVIEGVFHGIQNRVVANMGQLVDIQIRCKIQRNKKEEITNLYNMPFLQGKVVSINVDVNDINDIVVYLVNIKPMGRQEMETMINYNHVIAQTKRLWTPSADEPNGALLDKAIEQAKQNILH